VHEVLRVIEERVRTGSRPGQRTDGLRVALAIEGGGMRGTVSAGMALALHERGLMPAFDAVYGSSAGAITGAWLLSSEPERLHGWAHPDYARTMIRWSALLRRRPVADVRTLVEVVYQTEFPMDFGSILASPIEYHPLATDAATGTSTDLGPMISDAAELRLAIRASAALPFLAGPPVRLRGRRYYDAGVSETIPFRTPVDQGATHILVLRTRQPRDVPDAAIDAPGIGAPGIGAPGIDGWPDAGRPADIDAAAAAADVPEVARDARAGGSTRAGHWARAVNQALTHGRAVTSGWTRSARAAHSGDQAGADEAAVIGVEAVVAGAPATDAGARGGLDPGTDRRAGIEWVAGAESWTTVSRVAAPGHPLTADGDRFATTAEPGAGDEPIADDEPTAEAEPLAGGVSATGHQSAAAGQSAANPKATAAARAAGLRAAGLRAGAGSARSAAASAALGAIRRARQHNRLGHPRPGHARASQPRAGQEQAARPRAPQARVPRSVQLLTRTTLRNESPEFRAALLTRSARTAADVKAMAAGEADGSVFVIFPPPTTPPVSRLTTDSVLLAAALEAGRQAVNEIFGP
jgi:predicted acylesterase/phospholipase RssA